MPDDENKDILLDPSLDTDDEPKLFHSCSKPDIVQIEGKEIKCDKEIKPIIENNNPWLKLSGFIRQTEEKLLKIIKKSDE